MRKRVGRVFSGATPPIALLYAPVPAYVLWMSFMRYSGPHSILVIPALLAFAAGYLDRRRNPLQVAVWLAIAVYGVIFIDALWELPREGVGSMLLIPVILAGAAAWTVMVIGVPTLICTILGHLVRVRSCSPRLKLFP